MQAADFLIKNLSNIDSCVGQNVWQSDFPFFSVQIAQFSAFNAPQKLP
jgi:hypothetical protein